MMLYDSLNHPVVLCCFRDYWEYANDSILRVIWYLAHAMLLENTNLQKYGAVFLLKPTSTKVSSILQKSPVKSILQSFRGALPIRMAACHIVNPNAIVTVGLRIVKFCLGSKLSKRLILHHTPNQDDSLIINGLAPRADHEDLHGGGGNPGASTKTKHYGLSVHHIPTMFGGKLELNYEQFLQERKQEEERIESKWENEEESNSK